MMVSGEGRAVRQENFVLTVDPLQPSGVVMSVPHDADRAMGRILPRRTTGTKVRDLHVRAMAADIAAAAAVHLVCGELPRDTCDYNRAAPEMAAAFPVLSPLHEAAFEDEAVRPYWEAYYAALAVRLRTGGESCGLLIDLHGFARQPPYGEYDIILGTANRDTVRTDVDQWLGEFLRDRGHTVFVPAEQPVDRDWIDWLSGGYTVRRMATELGVDAVQMEIGTRYRTKPNASVWGPQLAGDIAAFVREYQAHQHAQLMMR